jgi:hypothetical protein
LHTHEGFFVFTSRLLATAIKTETITVSLNCMLQIYIKKLRGLSLQENYIDRATAACRKVSANFLRIEGDSKYHTEIKSSNLNGISFSYKSHSHSHSHSHCHCHCHCHCQCHCQSLKSHLEFNCPEVESESYVTTDG